MWIQFGSIFFFRQVVFNIPKMMQCVVLELWLPALTKRAQRYSSRKRGGPPWAVCAPCIIIGALAGRGRPVSAWSIAGRSVSGGGEIEISHNASFGGKWTAVKHGWERSHRSHGWVGVDLPDRRMSHTTHRWLIGYTNQPAAAIVRFMGVPAAVGLEICVNIR